MLVSSVANAASSGLLQLLRRCRRPRRRLLPYDLRGGIIPSPSWRRFWPPRLLPSLLHPAATFLSQFLAPPRGRWPVGPPVSGLRAVADGRRWMSVRCLRLLPGLQLRGLRSVDGSQLLAPPRRRAAVQTVAGDGQPPVDGQVAGQWPDGRTVDNGGQPPAGCPADEGVPGAAAAGAAVGAPLVRGQLQAGGGQRTDGLRLSYTWG